MIKLPFFIPIEGVHISSHEVIGQGRWGDVFKGTWFKKIFYNNNNNNNNNNNKNNNNNNNNNNDNSVVKPKSVAIKMISYADDGELTKIYKEITTMEKFRSKFASKVYGVCKYDNETLWIIFKYAEGGDLQNYLFSNSSLSFPQQISYCIQSALAVNCLHSNSILHTAIQCHNFLLSNNNQQLVLSKFIFLKCKKSGLQKTFLAPEVQSYQKFFVRDKSDIYSLGIVMIQIVSQKLPVIEKDGSVIIPPMENKRLRSIIARCCTRDPNDRPTASDLVNALSRIILEEEYTSDKETRDLIKEVIKVTGLSGLEPVNKYKVHYSFKELPFFEPTTIPQLPLNSTNPPIRDFESNNIDLKRLSNDPLYKDQLQKQFGHMLFANRHESLNSWYHPSVPIETHIKHFNYIQHLLASQQFDISTLSGILVGDMYLDKFTDLLGQKYAEVEGNTMTFLQVFCKFITAENFHELLSLFEKHKSILLHAKLSTLITNILQATSGRLLCESLIVNKDVKSLSYLAYGLTFFNESPVDIYPWHVETYISVKELLRNDNELLMIIFMYYYVNLIAVFVYDRPFLAGVMPVFNEAKKVLAYRFSSALQGHLNFIGDFVFPGLSHRSQKISHMMLFILLQLLKQEYSEFPLIKSYLKSSTANLINNTKNLTDSNYVHVQIAARRILYTLMNTDPWQHFVYDNYQANPDQLLLDILRPAPRKEIVSTLCSMVLEMSIAELKRVTSNTNTDRISFLLNETTFQSIFSSIVNNTKRIEPSTVSLSILLFHLVKTHSRLGKIVARDTEKGQKDSFILSVSSEDIQILMKFITDISHSNIAIVGEVRKHILATLRILLRLPSIFDFVMKDKSFYCTLLYFCKDGTWKPANAEAWKIFYEIMHYHADTTKYLITNSIFVSFLELVATYSPKVVITNGMNTLAKLFSMQSIEKRKSQRRDITSVEKDVHRLRFVHETPGQLFNAISKFYYVLQTDNGCSKLRKHLSKTTEYKESLDKINLMYNPVG